MKHPPAVRNDVAAQLGMSSQYLYQCLTGRRDMDPADAVRVEMASGGVIRRIELRRDWMAIWPELIGHPGAPAIAAPVHQAVTGRATPFVDAAQAA